MPIRVMWFSNAPWAATGYGGQSKLVIRRLRDDGHDVAVAANYGLAANLLAWEGIPVLPQGDDRYSNDILPAHYVAWARSSPAWLFTLYDVWPLSGQHLDQLPNIVSWTPVDHLPVPATTLAWFSFTKALPLAMSRYGEAQLRLAGLPEVAYAPHAIDTSTFRPGRTMADGRTAREYWDFPEDAFVVAIVGANKGNSPPRKGWGEMFSALGPFMAAHDDVWLYVHSERTGSQNGVDLDTLSIGTNLPSSRVKFADRYAYAIGAVGDQDLAAIMGSADVLLSPSYGEGFGIPVVEAMACGTPAIVNSFSAQPELLGYLPTSEQYTDFVPGPDAVGWLVEGQPWWDPHHNAWFQVPYIGSIIEQLEDAYSKRGDQGIRDRARARAMLYDVDLIWDSIWRPFLASLEPRTKPLQFSPPLPENRETRRAKKGRRR